jgi:hypothetical protein
MLYAHVATQRSIQNCRNVNFIQQREKLLFTSLADSVCHIPPLWFALAKS